MKSMKNICGKSSIAILMIMGLSNSKSTPTIASLKILLKYSRSMENSLLSLRISMDSKQTGNQKKSTSSNLISVFIDLLSTIKMMMEKIRKLIQ